MNPVQEKMIAEMGIGPRWKLRANSNENQLLTQVVTRPHFSSASGMQTDLSAQIELEDAPATESGNSTCQVCGWCSSTSKALASGQAPSVNYLFIAEHASDSESVTVLEAERAAEALLNGILRELRIKLGVSAYLANIVKTKTTVGTIAGRPVNGQDGEVMACVACLKKQIELLRPSVIISLGNNAAISLLALEANGAINDLRGTLYRYDGRPLIVTHQLDYLLRHPKEKLGLWSDLCLAMNTVQIH